MFLDRNPESDNHANIHLSDGFNHLTAELLHDDAYQLPPPASTTANRQAGINKPGTANAGRPAEVKEPPVKPAHLPDRVAEVNTRPFTAMGAHGRIYELHNLRDNTGHHNTPDAMVYIPDGFDPRKPVRVVVYNHGLGTNVGDAFKNSSLQQQMASADPNTVLIVPEWQTQTNSRISPSDAKFHQPGFFKNMLSDILDQTPPLHGMQVNDIASFGVVTHSGGYKAAMSEMYKNGLYDKVTSLTVLDSLYNPTGFDRWINDNIADLASGKKHLQVIYTDHLAGESTALARRIQAMLTSNHLPQSSLYFDNSHTNSVLDRSTIGNHGIVFKKSSFTTNNDGPHGSMTKVYVGEVLASEAMGTVTGA